MMEAAGSRLTPEEIEVGFVARRRPTTAEVRVGDELVVAVAPYEPCHLLNSTAALVWQSFDGVVDLGSLIDELAEAAGSSAEVIGPDVIELARHLGRLGLLEGVTSAAEVPVGAAPEATGPLGEGYRLEEFELPDADGRPHAWSSFGGRALLLVNWSPFCGYCLQIANGLGELRPQLAERDIDLVFVTLGGTEDNQPVLDRAGLGDATVLYARPGADPFAGYGTPAAYLIEADGCIAAPLAYGALEVPHLAARLAGVAQAAAPDSDARYLAGGGGACGPGGAGAPNKGTDWAGVAAFALGEFHVGIRYNNEETAALLDRLFPDARVEDPKVQDNYSVALYPPASGTARELNLLVRSGLQLVRSRAAARVLRALLGHLSADLYDPDPALLQADGLAVVDGEGEAVVLPSVLRNMWSVVAPRLGPLGLQVVDRPSISIDTGKAQLVVHEPVVPHDAAVLEGVDVGVRLGSELPAVAPGRYPLRVWVVATEERPAGPLSQAAAVAQSVGLVTRVPGLQRVLDQLAELFVQTEGYGLRYQGAEDFIGHLGALLA
jgi:hypothetical protein